MHDFIRTIDMVHILRTLEAYMQSLNEQIATRAAHRPISEVA